MPIDRYFNGKGREVMKKMRKVYGRKRGEEIFYATVKKMGMEGRVKKR